MEGKTVDELTLEIRQEKDTFRRLQLRDELFALKSQSVSMKKPTKKKRRRKKTCIWPECDNRAISLGMCSNCRTKHYNGKLLCADVSTFAHEEVIDLYFDVIKFMEEEGISRGEAVAWLIAEGLNSYERRKKGVNNE